MSISRKFIIITKKGENIRVTAVASVAEGASVKFMTDGRTIARFESTDIVGFYEDGENVQREVKVSEEDSDQPA